MADEFVVTIYRNDSRTPVQYKHVKHAWWEGGNYIVAQMSDPANTNSTAHHYWTWPKESISHVKEERV